MRSYLRVTLLYSCMHAWMDGRMHGCLYVGQLQVTTAHAARLRLLFFQVVFVRIAFLRYAGFRAEPRAEAQVNMPFRTLTQAGFTVYKDLINRADTANIYIYIYIYIHV